MRHWGNSGWGFLHSCSFAYPLNPTKKEKEAAFQLLQSSFELLPCQSCRVHALEYLRDEEVGVLGPSSPHLETRVKFAKWLFDFHNSVNMRIGKKVELDFGRVHTRYIKALEKSCSNGGCAIPARINGEPEDSHLQYVFLTGPSVLLIAVIAIVLLRIS